MLVQGMAIPSGLTGHEAGQELLSRLYRSHTGQELPPIDKTPAGKPCFRWGGLYFSISHTPHFVFCALSNRPVGMDAEELCRVIPPRFARRLLSPPEYSRYLCAPDRNRALLSLWVLKEAHAKLTGRGLRFPPNHTAFSPEDPRIREIHGCLVAVLEEETYAV